MQHFNEFKLVDGFLLETRWAHLFLGPELRNGGKIWVSFGCSFRCGSLAGAVLGFMRGSWIDFRLSTHIMIIETMS